MKEKVGGLEAKCDQYHSAQGDDPISEDIAGAPPEGYLGGVLHLMSGQISHIFPDSPSLSLWFSVGTTHIKSVWL